MKKTLEELIHELLEIADKHGGEVPTDVEEVTYQGPKMGHEKPKVAIKQYFR